MEPHVRPIADQRERASQRPLVYELVAAARSGDRGRFDDLFELWLRVVFAQSVRATGDRGAAEQLARKVLVQAVRSAAL